MIDLAKLAAKLLALWKMQESPHVEPPAPAPSYGTAGRGDDTDIKEE